MFDQRAETQHRELEGGREAKAVKREREQQAKSGGHKPKVTRTTGEVEWYTPPHILEAARRSLGGIDVDPASCAAAAKNVGARVFYAQADNGLTKPWKGRVWLNPPYARGVVSLFTNLLLEKLRTRETRAAVVLVNNSTETQWFQALLESASAVCLLRGRLKFINAEGETQGTPPQGQVVLYFGARPERFRREFDPYGFVVVTSRK